MPKGHRSTLCPSGSRRHETIRLRRKESDLPFPVSPPGKSRGGRGPPTPEARRAPAKTAGTHRCCRLPPQEGCRPLVYPPRAALGSNALYDVKRTDHVLIKPDNLTC